MASIKKINERKYKITVSNGYKLDGKKISRAKTINVPDTVRVRGIQQYVAHAAEEFEREVKLGYSEDGEMSFEEFSLRWLDRQKKYAPSTIASYRRLLSRVYPYIGSIQLNRLRPIALENMLMELRKRKHHGKSIQEATVQKYLTAVSAVLSDAKRNEIIQKNPARMIDLPDPEKATQIIPTADEAHRFLSILVSEPEVYKTYYVLALYTGCRRGELCALKWSDFTVIGYEGTLTISRSLTPVYGHGVTEGPTKNGKSRTIYMSNDMMNFVLTYRCLQKRDAEENGIPLSEYLFAGEDGKPVHPDTFTKHLRKLFDENGFPKGFHLHTLRHYFVSSLLHSGVDKQTVAELAGHGDTSFLERTYCHPQMALKQNAAQQMTEVMFPGSIAV